MARRIHSNDDDDDDGHPHASGSGSGGGSGSGQYHNEGSQSSVNGRRKRQKQTLETIFAKQDIAEKRAISVKLRELQSQAEEDRQNIKNVTFDDIRRKLVQQDDVFSQVRDMENGSLDARLFLDWSEMTSALSRKHRTDTSAFDMDNFLAKVKLLLGTDRFAMDEDDEDDLDGQDEEEEDELEDEEEARERRLTKTRAARSANGGGGGGVLGDWERIGWIAAKWHRRAPGVEFMYGPLAVEYQKRNIGPRAKKQALAPESRPEQVLQSAQTKQDDTPAYVARVGRLLKRLDPNSEGIPYFPFFIHPTSFGQSVENNFFVSFLIKEGKAGLGMRTGKDGTEQLMVTWYPPPDIEDGEDEEGDVLEFNQGVMELDMDTWKRAIEVFKITKPTIPHREPQHRPAMGVGEWYS